MEKQVTVYCESCNTWMEHEGDIYKCPDCEAEVSVEVSIKL